VYGRIPNKGERPKQPWVIIVVLPTLTVEGYLVEIPVSLLVGRVALKNVWIQLAYPRGRHGAKVLKAVPRSDEPGDFYRYIDLGPFSNMEATYPVTHADDRIVLVDIVAWPLSDLQEAEYSYKEGSDMRAPVPFRWTADKVTVTLRAENQRESSFTFWLAAVLSDDKNELEKQISLLAEALMRKDGIPIAKVQPGRRGFYRRRHSRLGLLFTPRFAHRVGELAIDRMTESNRDVQEIEFLPIGNAMSPVLSADTKPRPGSDEN
jgi:hypothetical protein